jgi:hypothetical protein
MILGRQQLRVTLPNISIQPSTTSISQNDKIAPPKAIIMTYDEDYTTETDILVDDILIINNTLQEYISIKNKNTHTETNGMTQEIITTSRLNYSVDLNTNKFTCVIGSITTLQEHGWTKNEDYTLIMLQEDEKIEIPFTTT